MVKAKPVKKKKKRRGRIHSDPPPNLVPVYRTMTDPPNAKVSEAVGQKRLIKAIKHLTMDQVAQLASFIITNDVVELERVAADRVTSNVLQVWYANVALKGIVNGDVHALNAMLDRIVGKAPDKLQLTGPNGGPITVMPLTREERVLEIERLRTLRQKAGTD